MYEYGRESPDGDEGRAYLFMHEPQKVGKDEGKIRASEALARTSFLFIIRIIYRHKDTGLRIILLNPVCLQSAPYTLYGCF